MKAKYISQLITQINTKIQTEVSVINKRNIICEVVLRTTKIRLIKSLVLTTFSEGSDTKYIINYSRGKVGQLSEYLKDHEQRPCDGQERSTVMTLKK